MNTMINSGLIISDSRLSPLVRMALGVIGTMTDTRSNRRSREVSAERERNFLNIIGKEETTISALCFSFSGSVAEYDDLRQDALVNIWRGMDGFRGESSLRTWIYRVVLNSCVSTIRKQSRFSRESESLDRLYDLVSEDSSADRERIEELHRLISCLCSEDKAMILMWLDEASYEEISSVMGLPRNTVATRLRRIKDKLIRMASSRTN